MSAAQRYGELPDGLREALRAEYGSDTEAAYALGVVLGASIASTSSLLGEVVGVDPAVLTEAIAAAVIA